MDGPGGQRALGEVIALLRQVIGDDPRWAARIVPSARLDADLRVDSLEMTALAAALEKAYGDRVDLPAFLAGLEFDQLVALTVADLAAYVGARGAGEDR